MELLFPVIVGSFFGLLTPFLLIYLNHDTRIRHIRLIEAIRYTFGKQTHCPSGKKLKGIEATPSFTMVLSKYVADIGEFERFSADPGADDTTSVGRRHPPRPFSRAFLTVSSNYKLLLTSLPYCVLVSFFFFVVTLGHFHESKPGGIFETYVVGSPFTTLFTSNPTCSASATCTSMEALFSVISFSFLGAYIFSLAYLLRAVAMFDLDGRLFFQGFRQIITSVIGASVIWRLWTSNSFADSGVSIGVWSFIAFVIGFLPDGAVRYMFTAVSTVKPFKDLVKFFKLTDDRFVSITKSIPLDVIDGVDTFTRFRLEVNGIYEVQNLATANAIMLHVETPYGLYQTIDWVAQAQLCTIVGPERFLAFRQFNIRTIFDLERATLGLRSTSQLRRIIGAILTSPTSTMADLQALCGSKYYTFPAPPPTGQQPPAPPASPAPLSTLESFWLWSRDLIGQQTKVRQIFRARSPDTQTAAAPQATPGCACDDCGKCEQVLARIAVSCFQPTKPDLTDTFDFETTCGPKATLRIWEMDDPEGTIKHIVRVIVDDLHVQRLRQIWESISRQLDADSLTLDDSEDSIYG